MDYAARYAELAVRVGANVQPGQRLVLLGEPEHAPLLRALAEAGWRAGAADVECLYLDEHIRRLHAIHAPDDLLDRTPAWVEIAALGAEGAASVQTLGDADPHLLADVDQSRAARAMPRRSAGDRDRPHGPPRDGLDGDRLPDGGLGEEPLRRARRGAAVAGDRRCHAPR